MSKKFNKRAAQQQLETSSTWDAISREETGNALSRERIVAAGIAVADQYGLAAVSIRKVASELESSAMALYHYVPSKRDLLNLMLDATYPEFELPAEAVTDWRRALSHFAWESRRGLKRHPWARLLHSEGPEYGPQCIRVFELLLVSLSQFGLDIRTCSRILGTLFIFVNGFVAAEDSEAGAPSSGQQAANGHPVFSKAILATGKFPRVARFVEKGAERPDDQAFERALGWILDGIAADIQPGARAKNKKRG